MQALTDKHIFIDRCFKKRVFDLAFSLFFIIISLPCWILIPIAIKLTSKGPVFYQSKRIGRGGKTIYCLKFRSMYQDADQRLKMLLKSNPKMKQEWEENFKLKSDPRITRVGQLLRKTSLDELPQFFNVIKGDLSIVGPRPITIKEHFRLKPTIRCRILQIKPGITGLWQTSGRSDLPWRRRIALELNYVKHRSLLFDLYLIVKTIPTILFNKGAY